MDHLIFPQGTRPQQGCGLKQFCHWRSRWIVIADCDKPVPAILGKLDFFKLKVLGFFVRKRLVKKTNRGFYCFVHVYFRLFNCCSHIVKMNLHGYFSFGKNFRLNPLPMFAN
jgi:hypothetical protein